MVCNVFFHAAIDGALALDCRSGIVYGEQIVISVGLLELFFTSEPDESDEKPLLVALDERLHFPFFLNIARRAYSEGTL